MKNLSLEYRIKFQEMQDIVDSVYIAENLSPDEIVALKNSFYEKKMECQSILDEIASKGISVNAGEPSLNSSDNEIHYDADDEFDVLEGGDSEKELDERFANDESTPVSDLHFDDGNLDQHLEPVDAMMAIPPHLDIDDADYPFEEAPHPEDMVEATVTQSVDSESDGPLSLQEESDLLLASDDLSSSDEPPYSDEVFDEDSNDSDAKDFSREDSQEERK